MERQNSSGFLGGVVEGFYGQPWTQAQRIELLCQLPSWGMNTYFYAPKDDLKHRAIWRESYSNEELAVLAELVAACEQRDIVFIYGLSPGLDIRFADPSERATIRRRFGQLEEVGARHFALLFDDLPGEIRREERERFASTAEAQCAVANETFAWLRGRHVASRLLFCPTPYCDRMARSELGGAGYLDEIGRLLAAEIDVLWTGPEIVSEEISVASIRQLSQRIGRPPVIWDNLFANDYDLRRLYCGPYSGRATELRDNVRGILANPNNEFPINYVPLRTLGQYLTSDQYDPRTAFLAGVDAWLAKFTGVGEPITREELTLLADCYYLPHEQGPEGIRLQQLAARLLRRPATEADDDYEAFSQLQRRFQSIFEKLTELKDRSLFYAWSRRAWELNEELDLLRRIIDHRRGGDDLAAGVASDAHLPGTYRGGIVAALQGLLAINDSGEFRRVAGE